MPYSHNHFRCQRNDEIKEVRYSIDHQRHTEELKEERPIFNVRNGYDICDGKWRK
jgi:hypothetical protein